MAPEVRACHSELLDRKRDGNIENSNPPVGRSRSGRKHGDALRSAQTTLVGCWSARTWRANRTARGFCSRICGRQDLEWCGSVRSPHPTKATEDTTQTLRHRMLRPSIVPIAGVSSRINSAGRLKATGDENESARNSGGIKFPDPRFGADLQWRLSSGHLLVHSCRDGLVRDHGALRLGLPPGSFIYGLSPRQAEGPQRLTCKQVTRSERPLASGATSVAWIRGAPVPAEAVTLGERNNTGTGHARDRDKDGSDLFPQGNDHRILDCNTRGTHRIAVH